MTYTTSDYLVDRLRAWGVQHIFGYPGDGINGVIGALARAEHDGRSINFVQVAHEELASLAATAYAKFSGSVGVCLSTGGPGAIHLLNGLYDAKLDHQPVVALVGQQGLPGLGGDVQQEVDLPALLHDVASAYVQTVAKAEQLRHVLDRAFRIALGECTVTAVVLPHDLQREPATPIPPHEHGRLHSGVGYAAPRVIPSNDQLRDAAAVLNAGNRVAMLVGAGALNAKTEVSQLAEQLNAGVAKALLGKAVIPDGLPYVTGSIGWLGTRASNTMMQECDTLLMIGTSFPYTEFLPKEGQARGVQIDVNARQLSLRYPMEVALAGDSADTIRAILPLITKKPAGNWSQRIEQLVRESVQEEHAHAMTHASSQMSAQASAQATPLNPKAVVQALSHHLPQDAVVTGDSGSAAVWIARHIPLRDRMKFSLSGGLATMGSGVPYAFAAKYASPRRAAVAIVGDGAMQMMGINGLIDIAKHWPAWRDPRLIVLVLNNRDLNYVTWEQRVMEGDPRYVRSQAVPDFQYAEYAKLLGLGGQRVERPDQVDTAWQAAFASDRPFVIDAVVDADVPTLPPMLTHKQLDMLDQALAHDPAAERVRRQMEEQAIGVGAS